MLLAQVQKGPGVVMLERSEASGGGVNFNICTFLHFGHVIYFAIFSLW
jgi:hypothetical protein